MAPQIGPNDAPMMTNTGTTCAARPVTARMMLTAAPKPTEMNGFTLGNVVLKLFAAMKDEKHADGNAANASRNMSTRATLSPSTTLNRLVVRYRALGVASTAIFSRSSSSSCLPALAAAASASATAFSTVAIAAASALPLNSFDPCTPATMQVESPAVRMMASAMPNKPP
ncbi:MAG: hypothetical protein BWX84_02237 [Verrucomicrobia bacterium ADurb.Bin118]|nr:MAG: hypothetical protein BWX84_02237 [Verrucomicrobia bacterium ADurb.Bin118]